MSSIGTGYDLAAGTFSPDGRIFQVEYAMKAVEGSGTVIGLRGKDGVVLAVEKIIPNDLIEPTANSRIINVTKGVGMAVAGLYPDGKHLQRWATDQAGQYYDEHRLDIPIAELVMPLGDYVHQYTLSMLRPFGCSVFLSGWKEDEGSHLWMVDPAGHAYEYTGWALGKHRQAAKTEIEKLKLTSDNKIDKSLEDLVKEAAVIIHKVRDESKDKKWQLEMSWVGEKTKGIHKLVPDDVIKAANAHALSQMDEDEEDEEDSADT